ncbi:MULTISPECIES: hypothetical protein [unclassified Vibrio]|uniref:hypothetical protein n=1 Tax=unclassified Vibrio TaxID=2614977 RepID=UPI0012678D61|nr:MULTISPECIES: hypothetical protein [unclassified Vibrio]MCM5509765.1 hypothetical protein [Vibrio sp. SCSIO 43169]QFT35974.1 hypothetical protein FIU99_05995 [Vibrio sp. THAF64]QGM33874.1 hypothetical protein GGC04_06005 [Vibrio sp. THAF191d]QGN69376.1 hypothetical protein GGC03_06010 [Vibrio sp. THAF191c]
MLSSYLTLFKAVAFATVLGGVAYLSYDYGVTTTETKALKAQNALWDKVEQKQDEAFQLAVKLANQKPDIRIEFREIEKEVIKYAQKNSDKQCVVNDSDWLRIRSNAVRAHNRALSIQQPTTVSDGSAAAASGYERDAEVLAEDVANLQICAENAQQLQSLQTWIRSQL